METVGGDGTPDVEEFTAEPLGAVFTITNAALQLISDALDLAYRLPRVWARVETLELPAWRARRIAQATTGLTREQAAAVDAQLAPKAHTCGTRAIEQAIAEVTATEDPVEQDTEEVLDRSRWEVRLFHGPMTGPGRWVGTSILQITGDTADLTHLYHQITTQAAAIDTGDPVEVRRAIAVGVLARKMNGGTPARVKLFVHADLADLTDTTIGTGSVERLGPLTLARIRDWVAHSSVTVLPVLRMDRCDAVDRHDPPAWMHELVVLRDRHCVFPHCQTDARSCYLDHIIEHLEMALGGPPGQTHPDNLAPLCRRHHRAKTRRRWRYRREPDGTYTWTGPTDACTA